MTNHPYHTGSLPLAAFLALKGCKITKTFKEGKHVVFEFDDVNSVIGKHVSNYFNNENVPVIDYHDALRRMKTILYEMAKEGE
jgi:hypothetical protein